MDSAALDRPDARGDADALEGCLAGVRVLDASSVIMGPFATQILGDLGADVISVEDRRGDTNRAMGPGPARDLSGVSLNLLRNKRNICLDLKHPEGREAFLALAATCDVLVTNLRPGPLARLRLGYDDVRAVRPDVVFCQAYGWSRESGRADLPAYDDVMQAETGIADTFARQLGTPQLAPTLVADKVSGMTIAYAVLAALFRRERTGRGQYIEVPMNDAVRAFTLVEHGAGAVPVPPLAPAGYSRILTPRRQPQRTSDGWINVLPYSRENYDALFRAGGRSDLVGDERTLTGRSRIANADSLYADAAAVLAGDTTAHWMAFCAEHDIPAARLTTLDELVEALPVAEHPDAGAYRQIPPPARFSESPAGVRRHAPHLGQHGREVLAELGWSETRIDDLRDSGALHLPA